MEDFLRVDSRGFGMDFEQVVRDMHRRFGDDYHKVMIDDTYSRCDDEGLVREATLLDISFAYATPTSDYPFVGEYVMSSEQANEFVRFMEGQGFGSVASEQSTLVFPKTVADRRVQDLVAFHEHMERLSDDHTLACYAEITAYRTIRDARLEKAYLAFLFDNEWKHPGSRFESAIPGITEIMTGTNAEKLEAFYSELKHLFNLPKLSDLV